MLCTECHVGRGPELPQVSFNPAALIDAYEINLEISLDKCGIKSKHEKIFYQYLSFKSVYGLPCENDEPLCKCEKYSDSHGRCTYLYLKLSLNYQ